MQKDAELIARLGGPTKVAEALGFDKAKGGTQRVQNWLGRGIPAAVKLRRPDLFLVDAEGRSLLDVAAPESTQEAAAHQAPPAINTVAKEAADV